MDQKTPIPIPEQMQEKECVVLEDLALNAVQILSEQTDQAHENNEHAPLFVP